MTDETPTAIPIEEQPDPIVAYARSNGEALITATNGRFEDLFDTAPSPTSVTDLFDSLDIVDSTEVEDLMTVLRRGESAGIRLEGDGERNRFLVRVIPADEDSGYVAFTALDEFERTETADIGNVASVISHDLRNPLDVAEAHLQAARETGETEHFDAVASAHDRMERIIQDVLTLARGQDDVSPSEQIDIEAVVEDAWSSVTTDHGTLTTSESLPTTTADSDRLRRVFENLFRNAVEHGSTSSRPATDDVEHGSASNRPERSADSVEHGAKRRDEPDAGRVTITVGPLENGFFVSDDGPGVPTDEQDAVFRPGYSTKESGTGLGLAIVDMIVSAHGWNVTLTTGTNGGARFEVRF